MYTSGTTGDPKAVMLTHSNFYSNVNQIFHEVEDYIEDDDVFLSFMPLSHSLERTCGYYFPIKFGCKVAFAESFATIAEDLQIVQPTVMVSAPRIYEKIHGGILAKVSEASPIKSALFNRAVKIARKNLPYICNNKKRRGFFKLRYNFLMH